MRANILGLAAKGEFQTEPAFAAQLSYEMNGGEYIFAVSYVNLELEYQPAAGEIGYAEWSQFACDRAERGGW